LCLNAYGQVWATGGNGAGELGLGDTNPRYEWEYNSVLPYTIGTASGLGHTLFVNYNGTLTASGLGAAGQLGNGTTLDRISPTSVESPFGNVSMAGGAYHSLILAIPPILLNAVSVSPTSVTGGTTVTGTVKLNGKAGPGGQRVYLYSFSVDQYGHYVDAATMPAYVDVPPSSSYATFAITTKKVASTTKTTVAGYLNQTVSATLTIQP
jgi:hypothetical protein